MAEATALRKHRLDSERQSLKVHVAQLRRRLQEDRHEVQDEASRLVGPQSSIAEHPRGLVAGSAAVGFILGATSSHVPRPNLNPVDAARGVAGKGTEAVANALKVEAAVVIKDFLSGVLGAAKEAPR